MPRYVTMFGLHSRPPLSFFFFFLLPSMELYVWYVCSSCIENTSSRLISICVWWICSHSRYRPELALYYMFYDDLEDSISVFFFFLITQFQCGCCRMGIACCRQFRMFPYFVFLVSFFLWTEGKCRAVPQGLRELRPQIAGPVSSQRSVRTQESLHGKTQFKWMKMSDLK